MGRWRWCPGEWARHTQRGRVGRADRVLGSERAVRPWPREPGERATEPPRGLVVLGLAGVWVLHEEQTYFRHSECWQLFILPLIFHPSGVSIPSSNLFPKTQSGQVEGWGL